MTLTSVGSPRAGERVSLRRKIVPATAEVDDLRGQKRRAVARRANLTCDVMARGSGAPYAGRDDRSAGSVRGTAPPMADDAAHDAVGPRARRRQFDPPSLLSRDRTIAAQPRDDPAPCRAPGGSAARPEHAAAGRRFRAGVS